MKTHCRHGHEYTPDNTYIFPSRNRRYCKTCMKESHQRLRQQKIANRGHRFMLAGIML